MKEEKKARRSEHREEKNYIKCINLSKLNAEREGKAEEREFKKMFVLNAEEFSKIHGRHPATDPGNSKNIKYDEF